ncbi:uncharacterized protein LACBIDRAFT_335634 [Laccaria bicolor S238N-H82]|uniref:Predicted protein n=1 Tax=Laccaria bicolor (strain S238N-H82 / ATCC MYA-4686) TaxID=486041 RepID=B0E2X1_LACBS|nr:uncharacterized protein LACBIDRAFT_335634 [Laccaria bicolor S238N-H82]EDQ98811.1 predicted protein [Laccaria bicolor S238N-H82]|eukprot:XP_001890541.1 predicted protein [Laccaria bicolor S238N-H82]
MPRRNGNGATSQYVLPVCFESLGSFLDFHPTRPNTYALFPWVGERVLAPGTSTGSTATTFAGMNYVDAHLHDNLGLLSSRLWRPEEEHTWLRSSTLLPSNVTRSSPLSTSRNVAWPKNRSKTCDEIKREIEEGQLHLQWLLEQRKTISEQLDLHRDQVSPIRKVPPEIIRILFLLWASDRHFLRSPTHVSQNVLTGVCVSWKNIALGMPELWSSILVEIRDGVFYPDKRTVEMWIERSGSSALSFSIEERDSSFHSSHAGVDQIPPTMPHDNTNSEHPAGSPVAPMLDLFIPHHSRWQRVCLRYNDASPDLLGIACLPIPMNTVTYPFLEEVCLDKGYWWAQEDLEHIKSMMVSAPRLHSVTWLSEKSYKMLALPWKQLTHFNSQGPIATMNEGLRVLAICPHLKSLELTLFLPMFPVVDDDDPFVHNTLERLHLRTAGNLAVLIDKVTLPALKDLSLSELHGASPNPPIQLGRWPQSQFLAFLLRSGCTIKQFIIQEWDISAEEIAECLGHPQISKSLDSLSITEYHQKHLCMTDEVLRLLTYSPSVILSENVLGGGDDQLADDTPSETICPNLTTIRLWGCISAQDGKVADMVESRWLSRTEGCPIVQLRTAAK